MRVHQAGFSLTSNIVACRVQMDPTLYRKRARRNAHQLARSLQSKNIAELTIGGERRYECLRCRGEWGHRRYAERHECPGAVPTDAGQQQFNSLAAANSARISGAETPRCSQSDVADSSVRLGSAVLHASCRR